MNFKQVWVFSSNEEAVEAAKRLKDTGIGSRISQPDKGVFGGLSQIDDRVWISVAEPDYQRACEVLGVTNEEPEAGGSYFYPPIRSDADKIDHPWTCPHCGEHLEAQFVSCWSCGTNRPDNE